jgi:hypothetical protein
MDNENIMGEMDKGCYMESEKTLLITERELGYEVEAKENVTLEEIRREYQNNLIIWTSGSGANPGGNPGVYRCVLDYKGNIKYLEGELPGATANQTMIQGATAAIECVNKPIRIFLISSTQLGFAQAFKGKGINAGLLQELCRKVVEKNCQLTEVIYYSGGESMKKFIHSCNPNQEQREKQQKKINEKEKYYKNYKKMVYDECLKKVTKILEEQGVEPDIIQKIREISAEYK